ncbi:GAF domain-containing protein [Alphaproteobacteria bacterium GH1-50]|uniref:GAF domain-containing protein n=1 Tax=Kangsaoukella pontilimi TaxID=2691042 RepID=A0A7C9NEZ9_9RHOB|nr:GAF domain-containing protein [Kangsaoukella pontilimi]
MTLRRPYFEFRDLGLVDGPADPVWCSIVRLSAELTGVRFGKLTVFDRACDRIVVRAAHGFAAEDLGHFKDPPSFPLCRRIIAEQRLVGITETHEDPEMLKSPFIERYSVRSYLGAPILDPANTAIGTLCVFDDKPRLWSHRQREQIGEMAHLVDQSILLKASLATIRLLSRAQPSG